MREILVGDDQNFTELIVSKFKINFPDYELIDLAEDNFLQLFESLAVGTLFSSKRSIICYNLDSLPANEYREFSSRLGNFQDNFLGLLTSEKKSLLKLIPDEISVESKSIHAENQYLKSLINFSAMLDYPLNKKAISDVIVTGLLSYQDLQNCLLLAKLGGLELSKAEDFMKLSSGQLLETPPWEVSTMLEGSGKLDPTIFLSLGNGVALVAYLAKRYLEMLQVLENKLNKSNIAEFFPTMHPYAAGLMVSQAQKFTPAQLKQVLLLLPDYDILIKSNPNDDVTTPLLLSIWLELHTPLTLV